MVKSRTNFQHVFSLLQADLYRITEDLAQLYHLVCQVTGETPSRVMLDHAKGGGAAVGEGQDEVKKEDGDKTEAADKKSVIANGKVRRLKIVDWFFFQTFSAACANKLPADSGKSLNFFFLITTTVLSKSIRSLFSSKLNPAKTERA